MAWTIAKYNSVAEAQAAEGGSFVQALSDAEATTAANAVTTLNAVLNNGSYYVVIGDVAGTKQFALQNTGIIVATDA